MGRRASFIPKPPCPEHPGSHVVFDGGYGTSGHRRQRYRCYPAGQPGGEYHRSTEALPRQMTVAGVGVECERHVHTSEGPPTPRRYEFSARDVARALHAVGAGESYRAASAAARRVADRMPVNEDGSERYSRHGQLVGDWVSRFAPVVFEPHRRWSWPKEGSIVLELRPCFLAVAARGDARIDWAAAERTVDETTEDPAFRERLRRDIVLLRRVAVVTTLRRPVKSVEELQPVVLGHGR